jgi:hypothetical protein
VSIFLFFLGCFWFAHLLLAKSFDS